MRELGHAAVAALGLRMPCRFLRGSGASLALTVGAIACGVALVCALDVASHGVVRAFVAVVDTMAGRAALQVTAGDGGFFPESVAATVSEVPGVTTALPVVQAMAVVGDGPERETLVIHATDLTSDAATDVYEIQAVALEDPLVLLAHPDSIVLTRPFAARHAIALGDHIDLVVPGGRRTFTVRGLVEPAGLLRAFGGNIAVMDLFSAQPVFTRPGLVTGVDVVVEPTADLAAVTDAIAAVLPPGLRVVTPAQRQADLQRVMRSLPVALDAMGLFCLAAAFLIAFNRLSTVFEARTCQIGVLRAVGLRQRVAWRELLKESVIIGAAGVGLGIPAGLALGRSPAPRDRGERSPAPQPPHPRDHARRGDDLDRPRGVARPRRRGPGGGATRAAGVARAAGRDAAVPGHGAARHSRRGSGTAPARGDGRRGRGRLCPASRRHVRRPRDRGHGSDRHRDGARGAAGARRAARAGPDTRHRTGGLVRRPQSPVRPAADDAHARHGRRRPRERRRVVDHQHQLPELPRRHPERGDPSRPHRHVVPRGGGLSRGAARRADHAPGRACPGRGRDRRRADDRLALPGRTDRDQRRRSALLHAQAGRPLAADRHANSRGLAASGGRRHHRRFEQLPRALRVAVGDQVVLETPRGPCPSASAA